MQGIGSGSPMNESDLLMMSLPPVLLRIGCYHNSSVLNYIDMRACIYDLSGSVHALPAEGKVSISMRVALTYEKYLVKFLRVYLTN